MPRTRPVIPVDAGWLFIVAGMAALCCCLILPAQRQIHEMRDQLAAMRSRERLTINRLRAYSDFLMAIDDRDPTLTRRLAAAQLNLARDGETPVLLSGSATMPVTQWIEQSVEPDTVLPTPFPESQLSELVTGEYREWILGGSVACLFIGLLVAPATPRARRDESACEPARGRRSRPVDLDEDFARDEPTCPEDSA